MAIAYKVLNNGHFIHATASGSVSGSEFVEYEVAHAADARINSPVSELFEIEEGALRLVTTDDVAEVFRRRCEAPTLPIPHRCAIVVSRADAHGWDLAKFYEGMVSLHSPKNVIVFGDVRIAKMWLGIEETHHSPPGPQAG